MRLSVRDGVSATKPFVGFSRNLVGQFLTKRHQVAESFVKIRSATGVLSDAN